MNGYGLGSNGPNPRLSGARAGVPVLTVLLFLFLSSGKLLFTLPKTGLTTAPFPLPHLSITFALVCSSYPTPKLCISTPITDPAALTTRLPTAPAPCFEPKMLRSGGPQGNSSVIQPSN